MTVRYCPYQGVKKMRYLFMAEHCRNSSGSSRGRGCRRWTPTWTRSRKDYGRTITEYVNHWGKTHQHLKQPGNWDPWFKGLKMAEHQAEEIAIRNVVEAL